MLEPIQLRRQTHLLCSNCGQSLEYYGNNRCWNCENDYINNQSFFSKFYSIIKKMFTC